MVRSTAGAVAIAVAAAFATAGCGAGTDAGGPRIGRASISPGTAAAPVVPAGVATPASTAPPAPVPQGDAGVSPSDLSAIDQGLADSQSALGQAATDAPHDEQGDATP